MRVCEVRVGADSGAGADKTRPQVNTVGSGRVSGGTRSAVGDVRYIFGCLSSP